MKTQSTIDDMKCQKKPLFLFTQTKSIVSLEFETFCLYLHEKSIILVDGADYTHSEYLSIKQFKKISATLTCRQFRLDLFI